MDNLQARHDAARRAYQGATDALAEIVLERIFLEITRFFPAADAVEIDAETLADGRCGIVLRSVCSGSAVHRIDDSLESELLVSVVDPLLQELGEVAGADIAEMATLPLPAA